MVAVVIGPGRMVISWRFLRLPERRTRTVSQEMLSLLPRSGRSPLEHMDALNFFAIGPLMPSFYFIFKKNTRHDQLSSTLRMALNVVFYDNLCTYCRGIYLEMMTLDNLSLTIENFLIDHTSDHTNATPACLQRAMAPHRIEQKYS